MGIPASFYATIPGTAFCTEGIVVSDGVQIRVQIGLQVDGTYGITLFDPNGNLILTGSGISANTITGQMIQAGTITADRLAAVLVLASTITTSAGYPNVTIDQNGIRCYASDGTILVNMPTDGVSPVALNGQVTASSLEVTGAALFESTAALNKNAVLTLQAGTQPPSAAPTIAQGLPTPLGLVQTTGWSMSGSGFYDSVGGSGGTPCFVAVEVDTTKPYPNVRVTEWNMTDGSINQSTALSGWSNEGSIVSVRGINRIGTNWYLTVISSVTNGILASAPRATGIFTAGYVDYGSYFYEIDSSSGEQLATDGTYLYLEGYSTTFLTVEVNSFSVAMAFYAVVTLALATPPGGATKCLMHDFDMQDDGDGQGVCFWLDLGWVVSGVEQAPSIFQFTASTGAIVANADWPQVSSIVQAGLTWDGTNWRHCNAITYQLNTYTNWVWTTASPKYWVRYSWYHSTGTTYETAAGPAISITMLKRRQLNVSTPSVPVGLAGLTDPDTCRTYLVPGSSDPGLTHYYLQATDSGTSRTLVTYNSGGAADGGGTPFPGGTGAVFQTSGGNLVIRGNGTAVLPGALLRETFYAAGASGTHTTIAGCNRMEIEVQAGGGAGAGTAAGPPISMGSGGHCGGWAYLVIASPAASYDYAVGADEAGTSGASGSAGNDSTWSVHSGAAIITAKGGAGGAMTAVGTTAIATMITAPVTGTTGGDINIDGDGNGTIGVRFSNLAAYSGSGSPSRWGPGGNAQTTGNRAGDAGKGAGAGGGASLSSSTAQVGGTGKGGIIRVREYG